MKSRRGCSCSCKRCWIPGECQSSRAGREGRSRRTDSATLYGDSSECCGCNNTRDTRAHARLHRVILPFGQYYRQCSIGPLNNQDRFLGAADGSTSTASETRCVRRAERILPAERLKVRRQSARGFVENRVFDLNLKPGIDRVDNFESYRGTIPSSLPPSLPCQSHGISFADQAAYSTNVYERDTGMKSLPVDIDFFFLPMYAGHTSPSISLRLRICDFDDGSSFCFSCRKERLIEASCSLSSFVVMLNVGEQTFTTVD